jgi:hypothetical protein
MSAPPLTPPTPRQFYIDYPLYEEFTFAEGQDREGWTIKYFGGTLDSFCPGCGTHSIFAHTFHNLPHDKDAWVHDHLFDVTLVCSRNKSHQLYFLFQVRGRSMQKIGQFPSLATLNLYDVKQYASILKPEAFRELTKAIGLAAHGVGIGSFVYLRRIFEGLVEESHDLARAEPAWDEAAYQSARMSERIQLLAGHLPKFLVDNRVMYGVLSKGVHELSENECLNAFSAIKVGIEIVLDAKLRAAAEQKKLAAAAQAIQRLAGAGGT